MDIFFLHPVIRSKYTSSIGDHPGYRVFEVKKNNFQKIQIVGIGQSIEIFKEVGSPEIVYDQFNLEKSSGTHMVGHTRMATESAVTTAGSHPFATGADLCLVHNGLSLIHI